MSNLATALIPKDLTDELYREYDLGNRMYRITEPQQLYVGNTTHRVVDKEGVAHCIPFPVAGNQIIALRWKVKDGRPKVAF